MELIGSPWCNDTPLMHEQACVKPFLPHLQRMIVIGAKDGCIGIQFGGDISRQRNSQGLASIFFMSSSLGLKRPCNASIMGLAI